MNLISFIAGFIFGIVCVGVALNLTILKQDNWYKEN
jgi:hypothetical protein